MAAIAVTMDQLTAAWKARRVVSFTLTGTQVFALVTDPVQTHTMELWVVTA